MTFASVFKESRASQYSMEILHIPASVKVTQPQHNMKMEPLWTLGKLRRHKAVPAKFKHKIDGDRHCPTAGDRAVLHPAI